MKSSRRSFLVASLAGLPALKLTGLAQPSPGEPGERKIAEPPTCDLCGYATAYYGRVYGQGEPVGLCWPHARNALELSGRNEVFTMYSHGILAARVTGEQDKTGRGYLQVTVPWIETAQRDPARYEPEYLLDGELVGHQQEITLWAEPVGSLPFGKIRRRADLGQVIELVQAGPVEPGGFICATREWSRVYYGTVVMPALPLHRSDQATDRLVTTARRLFNRAPV